MSFLCKYLEKKKSSNDISNIDMGAKSSQFLTDMLNRKTRLRENPLIKKEEIKIINLSSIYYSNISFPSNGWMFYCVDCRNATSGTQIFENKYEINICPGCQKAGKYQKYCNELISRYKKSLGHDKIDLYI